MRWLLPLLAVMTCALDDLVVRGENLFSDTCFRCHDDTYWANQDLTTKSWELVVWRMQHYAGFDDATAEAIIAYLGSEAFLKPPPPTAIAAPPAMPPAAVQQAYDDRWFTPSRAWVQAMRWFGYAAIACLVILALSGWLKPRLGARFQPVHRLATGGLSALITVHATFNLLRFGPMPVLWLWFGLVATVVLGLAAASGPWHQRLGSRYRAVHYGLAGLGALLAALHWVWAYL